MDVLFVTQGKETYSTYVLLVIARGNNEKKVDLWLGSRLTNMHLLELFQPIICGLIESEISGEYPRSIGEYPRSICDQW